MPPVVIGVNCVVDPIATLALQPRFLALVIEIVGNANGGSVVLEAPLVDLYVERHSASKIRPTVQRRYEFHPPELTDKEAQQVAFVVMTVPDRDSLLAAKADEAPQY